MGTLLTLTLFGSVIWFWILVSVYLIICFASEVNENGFPAFAFLIIFGVVFYYGDGLDPILSVITFLNGLIYFGIGLGFAFIRTFFAARKLGREIKENKPTPESQEYQKNRFLDDLKENVFRWWFMWPISLLAWIATDIVKDVYEFTYDKIAIIFKWIVNLGVKSV